MFEYWREHSCAPYAFAMDEALWSASMNDDIDGDGRKLFQTLSTEVSRQDGKINGLMQFGTTAFGFDETGEISDQVHYSVIRMLCFETPEVGQSLLNTALSHIPKNERVYAFFHYFGMTACARHGKLHESQKHVHGLLLQNGFAIEHENVYYSRILTGQDTRNDTGISLSWGETSPGSCREFAALLDGKAVCWGKVHFLPQGDIAYLRWIFTDEKLQHQGIGTRVMGQLFRALHTMGIRRFDTDTALSNTQAQKYYEKTGFKNEGITRSYYTR